MGIRLQADLDRHVERIKNQRNVPNHRDFQVNIQPGVAGASFYLGNKSTHNA
jgi:hypothetical protein